MEINLMREKKLYDASFRGDIQSLNELLREDEHILNYYHRPSPFCFNETPLHIAATRGHVDFAKALLQYKPNLVNEQDSRLRSPLHLGSANGHVEIVKLLLKADADVCLMEDKFGRTPLHLAAMVKGRVEVVNELVRARPEAIMFPLNKTKTIMILHLYVIHNGPEALEQLVEVDHAFLNSQDGEGNTILHKVVALKQLETLEYLVCKTQLAVNLKNGNSFTALDMIEQMPRDSQTTKMRELLVNAGVLNNETLHLSEPNTIQLAHGEIDQIEATSAPVSVAVGNSSSRDDDTKDRKENELENKKAAILESKRAAILVAATVIASMAFQAGLNPPGGVWGDNKSKYYTVDGFMVDVVAGTSIMATNNRGGYILFEAFNAASFIGAITIILLVIRGSPSFGTTWFSVLKRRMFMWFLTGVVWITMTTLAISYLVGVYFLMPWYVLSKGGPIVLVCSVLGWFGIICITLLGKICCLIVNSCRLIVNSCRLFICFIVKVTNCIIRSCRNAIEGEHLGHSNANTTTSCMSV